MKTVEEKIERNQRKHATGMVISDKMEKTLTVQVERLVKHPRYKKYIRKYTKLYAHDEKGEAKKGDVVEVMSTRPLSKLKRWSLVRIVSKAVSRDSSRIEPEQVLAGLVEKKA